MVYRGPQPDPTPEQIAERASAIRLKWDENTERRRTGQWGRHYEVPEVRLTIHVQSTGD